MRKVLLCIVAFVIALPVAAIASTTNCATKYPVVLAHGMATQGESFGSSIWTKISSSLQDNGAEVYTTSVNAMDSSANKAAQFKAQVLQILAISGKAKINIIGMSHGAIYTRYAIANLGLAPNVASYTGLAGPHRGSVIADMVMGAIPNVLEPLVGPVVDQVFTFVMGDKNGNSAANGHELERSNMINVFNPNTPNAAGVDYQSYAFKITNALGGGILLATWKAILPFDGANDGLVSITSAQWGNFKGVITGTPFFGGVNHMAVVGRNTLPTPGYDPPTFFASVVADLKNRGY